MGISHSVNRAQLDQVVLQFEATKTALKGIEIKSRRFKEHSQVTRNQLATTSRQVEGLSNMLDGIAVNANDKAELALDCVSEGLIMCADFLEPVEEMVDESRLSRVRKTLIKELGPLFVPTMVLILIITVSNCAFGFLLADDPSLSERVSLLATFGDDTEGSQGYNLVRAFTIVHVVAIIIFFIMVVFEAVRRLKCCQNGRRRLSNADIEVSVGTSRWSDDTELNIPIEPHPRKAIGRRPFRRSSLASWGQSLDQPAQRCREAQPETPTTTLTHSLSSPTRESDDLAAFTPLSSPSQASMRRRPQTLDSVSSHDFGGSCSPDGTGLANESASGPICPAAPTTPGPRANFETCTTDEYNENKDSVRYPSEFSSLFVSSSFRQGRQPKKPVSAMMRKLHRLVQQEAQKGVKSIPRRPGKNIPSKSRDQETSSSRCDSPSPSQCGAQSPNTAYI